MPDVRTYSLRGRQFPSGFKSIKNIVVAIQSCLGDLRGQMFAIIVLNVIYVYAKSINFWSISLFRTIFAISN